MGLFDEFRVDRTKLSVGSLDEPSDEKAFWLSKTPAERMRALEHLRQVAYGYERATAPLKRVLEVVQPEEDRLSSKDELGGRSDSPWDVP